MNIRAYYELIKPGIVYGNAISTIGGFALAARNFAAGRWNFPLLAATVVGLSFVIAAICVFNNYIDREIDAKMERTKNRPLVTGAISGRAAIVYGCVLGAIGLGSLWYCTNPLTVLVAVVGSIFYVYIYAVAKRRSVHGTLVGAIAGATPPIVGYCAVANTFDFGAAFLFFIMCFWQMPHFYAIAIYRSEEYAAAGIPVLPVKRGVASTKIQMLFYVIAFGVAASLLTAVGLMGWLYLTIVLPLSLIWLVLAVKGFWAKDDNAWARMMFRASLVVMLVLFGAMVIG